MNHAIILDHPRPAISVTATLRRVGETLAVWRRRMRERDELSRWTEREMHDVGINSADAWLEIRKPFWRG
jgi:uncharacterized protein YjiS (DUF1127 family)